VGAALARRVHFGCSSSCLSQGGTSSEGLQVVNDLDWHLAAKYKCGGPSVDHYRDGKIGAGLFGRPRLSLNCHEVKRFPQDSIFEADVL